jgi:hypothetical protein
MTDFFLFYILESVFRKRVRSSITGSKRTGEGKSERGQLRRLACFAAGDGLGGRLRVPLGDAACAAR